MAIEVPAFYGCGSVEDGADTARHSVACSFLRGFEVSLELGGEMFDGLNTCVQGPLSEQAGGADARPVR